MLQKNTFGVEVLRDINKLKNGHYYRHRGVAFRFFRLLPVSGSAFPSRDQSTYSERSYCTQIWLEGYIMYPLHQSMFFAFLYHFFFRVLLKKEKYIYFLLKKILSSTAHKRLPPRSQNPPFRPFRELTKNRIRNRANYIIIVTGRLLLLLLFTTLCFIHRKQTFLWLKCMFKIIEFAFTVNFVVLFTR